MFPINQIRGVIWRMYDFKSEGLVRIWLEQELFHLIIVI